MIKVDLEKVRNLMQEASETIVIPYFGELTEEQVFVKGPGDLATIADMEVEAFLVEKLSALLPGSVFVREEEFSKRQGSVEEKRGQLQKIFQGSAPVWTIDPVDGTWEYRHGKKGFGIIVSLTQKNEPLAGWLYDPLSNACIMTEKGAGTFFEGRRLTALAPAALKDMCGSLSRDLYKAYCGCDDTEKPGTPASFPALAACHGYAQLLLGGSPFAHGRKQMHYRMNTTDTPWDNVAGSLAWKEAGGVTFHWDGASHAPDSYQRGLIHAPDAESWQVLRKWASCLEVVSA